MQLATLHKKSRLAICDDLSLFEIRETQYSHESDDLMTVFPTNNKLTGDHLEFVFRNTTPFMYDLDSAILIAKARIVRADGKPTYHEETPQQDPPTNTTTTSTSTSTNNTIPTGGGDSSTKPPATSTSSHVKTDEKSTTRDTVDAPPPKQKLIYDRVIPVRNIGMSMFSQLDVHLQNKLISNHDLIPYRAFLGVLFKSNPAMDRHTLWTQMYHAAEKEEDEDSLQTSDNMQKRWKRTRGSRIFDIVTRISSDAFEQPNLLVGGVELRMNFKLSSDDFKLLSFEDPSIKYKLELVSAELELRRVKIFNSVTRSIEERMLTEPSLYLLKGVQTRIRSLQEGSKDIIMENLTSQTPSKMTFMFIKTSAFYGTPSLDPFCFEHMNMRRCTLSVGTKQQTFTFDFDNGLYAHAYYHLLRNIGNKHVVITREQYAKNTFLLHYILSPSRCPDALSPITSENVRFHAEFTRPLDDAYTCVILIETERVLEISHDRQIEIA